MDFWSQIKTFLFFCKILQLDKFEDADYKYDNNKAPLVPKLGIFIFSRNFATRKIREY